MLTHLFFGFTALQLLVFALVKIINYFSLYYSILTQAVSLDVKSVDLPVTFIQVVEKVV